jgi:hypothetical protein
MAMNEGNNYDTDSSERVNDARLRVAGFRFYAVILRLDS